jgi:hypothetical protein
MSGGFRRDGDLQYAMGWGNDNLHTSDVIKPGERQ